MTSTTLRDWLNDAMSDRSKWLAFLVGGWRRAVAVTRFEDAVLDALTGPAANSPCTDHYCRRYFALVIEQQ